MSFYGVTSTEMHKNSWSNILKQNDKKERRRERYKVELLRYICVTKELPNKEKNCTDYLCVIYFV